MAEHQDEADTHLPAIRHYARGEAISREGDEDFGWFILRRGRVGVFKGNVQIEVFYEPGMVFGELSGILRRPRTASLVALDECEVLYLTADLDELIAHHPTVVKKIVETLAERLAKTTDNLWMRAGRA
jgi:CRP-like cAMP-binding protein